jgi:hypothetical protein
VARGLSPILSSASCLVSQAFCTICGERMHPLQRLGPIYPCAIAPCARGIYVNSDDDEEAVEEREFFTYSDFSAFSLEFGVDEACSRAAIVSSDLTGVDYLGVPSGAVLDASEDGLACLSHLSTKTPADSRSLVTNRLPYFEFC